MRLNHILTAYGVLCIPGNPPKKVNQYLKNNLNFLKRRICLCSTITWHKFVCWRIKWWSDMLPPYMRTFVNVSRKLSFSFEMPFPTRHTLYFWRPLLTSLLLFLRTPICSVVFLSLKELDSHSERINIQVFPTYLIRRYIHFIQLHFLSSDHYCLELSIQTHRFLYVFEISFM